jgi:hypothetical protein
MEIGDLNTFEIDGSLKHEMNGFQHVMSIFELNQNGSKLDKIFPAVFNEKLVQFVNC